MNNLKIKIGDYRSALILVTSLYLLTGFMTSVNDILIPFLRELFHLSYLGGAYVQFFFYISPFLFASLAAQLIIKIEYKFAMALSIFIISVGCFLFLLSARFTSYANFLLAFFVIAIGLTLLQVAANTFVTLFGDAKLAASRLSIFAALNATGAVIGPYVASKLILARSHELQVMTTMTKQAIATKIVQMPYLILTLM